MATIMVGSARISENGNAGWDGKAKAGDQTGSEVSQQTFYTSSKGWYIFNWKDAALGEAAAKQMINACNNSHIGYDQSQRDTLFNYVKKNNIKDLSQVKENVETDCSALVRVIIYLVTGGTDVGNIRTVSMPTTLSKFTNLFEPKVKYVSQTKTATYNGCILVTCTSGHTVIVTSGSPKKATTATKPAGIDTWKDEVEVALKLTGYSLSRLPYIKQGAKSQVVKLIQKRLNSVGFHLQEDGDFGPKTDEAVKVFQKNRKIEVDGIVGPDTWSWLFDGRSF